MAFNQYVGWGLTTLLTWLINRSSNSSSETSSLLNENNSTKIGTPIPVILGRHILKEPLVSYFGDFSASKYTESYSSWGSFNATSLVLYLITDYIALRINGHQVDNANVSANLEDTSVSTSGGSGNVNSSTVSGTSNGATYKDDTTGQLLNALWVWLLGWLINGRMLRTTIQKGFKYYLGWQMVLCWSSPQVGIRNIWMNVYNSDIEESSQAAVWSNGTANIVNNPAGIVASINNENMFGGVDEQGGFVGDIHIYFGGENQSKDSWMVNQMSLSTVQESVRGLTPLYKPFVTAVVHTAYIGKQSTIPSMWFEVVNYPNNLGFSQIGYDCNPAEAIYEILTNTDWGCGINPNRINIDSLVKLGNTCNTESMGVSLRIDANTTAKTVIDKILSHINGVVYDNPFTGKLEFKLIRNDYDVNKLITLNTSNCQESEFARLDWSETKSVVTVAFTDPNNYFETSSVPYNDIANRKITGLYADKSVDGSYFSTSANAKTLAQTESLSAGYPLATATIKANRAAYGLTMGDVFKYSWLPYGISDMVMRVADIDYGEIGSGLITISAIEDVFGFDKTVYTYSNGAEWTTVEHEPTEVSYYELLELPYEMSKSKNTYLYIMAVQPASETVYWDVWRYVNSAYTKTAKGSIWTTGAKMVYGFDRAFANDSTGFEIKTIGVSNDLDKYIQYITADPTTYNNMSGSNLVICDDEIMSYNSITKLPNGNYQLKGIVRGVYDTVPVAHTSESIVYFLNTMLNTNGNNYLVASGSTSAEQVVITTETLDKSANIDYNSIMSYTTARRAEQPSIMANLKLGANMGTNTTMEYTPSTALSGELLLTFNPRNKFVSNTVVNQLDSSMNAVSTLNNIVRMTLGNSTVEYKYDDYTATGLSFKWEDFCKDFTITPSNAVTMRVMTYDTATELYSYSKYSVPFTYIVPTMVGVVADKATAQSYANSIVKSNNIVIPESDYIPQTVITYNSCPFIAVYNYVGSISNGIMGQDGNYYILSTTMYRIDGIALDGTAILSEFTMNEYYVFASKFNTDINNDTMYYRYYNNNFVSYSIS